MVVALAGSLSDHADGGGDHVSGGGGGSGEGQQAASLGLEGLLVLVNQDLDFLRVDDGVLLDNTRDERRGGSRGPSRGRRGRCRGGSGGAGGNRCRLGSGSDQVGSSVRVVRSGSGGAGLGRGGSAARPSEEVAEKATNVEVETDRGGHRDTGGAGTGRSVRDGVGVLRTPLDGQTVDKTSGASLDLLFLALERIGNLELALQLIGFALNVEQRAVLNFAGSVGALLDRSLQSVLVPALNEVTVVAESGRVTVSQDEVTLVVLEGVGVPDGLEEERNDTGLEALRAGTVHDQRRVGDVRGVVIAIDILAVPARGEHHLETDTVSAVLIQVSLVGQEVTTKRGFCLPVVVQAVETNSLLLEGRLGGLVTGPLRLGRVGDGPSEVALEGVTGKHAESLREGLDIIAIQEIVPSSEIS